MNVISLQSCTSSRRRIDVKSLETSAALCIPAAAQTQRPQHGNHSGPHSSIRAKKKKNLSSISTSGCVMVLKINVLAFI